MQRTLEARLGESFRLVNGQLENVYRGVGEMRKLAEGVGDLKRVLSGVKTRGIWGEARLRAILSESLTNSQYEENVAVVPGSQERVEFAVRLPGRDEGAPVWLAVDSKFPLEDYQRLIEAGERGDANDVKKCAQALENAVLEQARRISRYIDPPHTADFAVMFLPAESLYGEVLARPGLIQKLQSRYHVLPAGRAAFRRWSTVCRWAFARSPWKSAAPKFCACWEACGRSSRASAKRWIRRAQGSKWPRAIWTAWACARGRSTGGFPIWRRTNPARLKNRRRRLDRRLLFRV